MKHKLVKRGPRPNKKPVTKHVVFAGANINGAKSKWKSWKKVIKDTKANVFFVQETKCDQANTLKMDGFIIFDKVRINKGGGGVAIAAKRELNPVLVSEADGDIDAITIDINTKNISIACTSAYGPQNSASTEIKTHFWEYLNSAALIARNAGKGFLLQGDLNVTLGSTMISGDRNPQNDNAGFISFSLTG